MRERRWQPFSTTCLRPVLRSLQIPEQQIPSGQNTDELAVPHDRHSGEITVLKQIGHLGERLVFRHRQGIGRHDLGRQNLS